jgi:lysophospholipase L1-like esterase
MRWVAMGDSFTAGTDPADQTWASLVRERAGRTSPTALLNLAQVGARIDQIEREQLPIAYGIGPDLVTLICGGNDVIGSVRPRDEDLAADLDRIYGRLVAGLPRARLLTATYPPIAAHALRPRTRRRVEDGMRVLNSIIRSAAATHGIACIELADHPGQVDSDNYAADGIHPSQSGHRAAAEVIGPSIETLLNPTQKELR